MFRKWFPSTPSRRPLGPSEHPTPSFDQVVDKLESRAYWLGCTAKTLSSSLTRSRDRFSTSHFEHTHPDYDCPYRQAQGEDPDFFNKLYFTLTDTLRNCTAVLQSDTTELQSLRDHLKAQSHRRGWHGVISAYPRAKRREDIERVQRQHQGLSKIFGRLEKELAQASQRLRINRDHVQTESGMTETELSNGTAVTSRSRRHHEQGRVKRHRQSSISPPPNSPTEPKSFKSTNSGPFHLMDFESPEISAKSNTQLQFRPTKTGGASTIQLTHIDASLDDLKATEWYKADPGTTSTVDTTSPAAVIGPDPNNLSGSASPSWSMKSYNRSAGDESVIWSDSEPDTSPPDTPATSVESLPLGASDPAIASGPSDLVINVNGDAAMGRGRSNVGSADSANSDKKAEARMCAPIQPERSRLPAGDSMNRETRIKHKPERQPLHPAGARNPDQSDASFPLNSHTSHADSLANGFDTIPKRQRNKLQKSGPPGPPRRHSDPEPCTSTSKARTSKTSLLWPFKRRASLPVRSSTAPASSVPTMGSDTPVRPKMFDPGNLEQYTVSSKSLHDFWDVKCKQAGLPGEFIEKVNNKEKRGLGESFGSLVPVEVESERTGSHENHGVVRQRRGQGQRPRHRATAGAHV